MAPQCQATESWMRRGSDLLQKFNSRDREAMPHGLPIPPPYQVYISITDAIRKIPVAHPYILIPCSGLLPNLYIFQIQL